MQKKAQYIKCDTGHSSKYQKKNQIRNMNHRTIKITKKFAPNKFSKTVSSPSSSLYTKRAIYSDTKTLFGCQRRVIKMMKKRRVWCHLNWVSQMRTFPRIWPERNNGKQPSSWMRWTMDLWVTTRRETNSNADNTAAIISVACELQKIISFFNPND